MAYEMTQFTKNQILQQTGIAMLSRPISASATDAAHQSI